MPGQVPPRGRVYAELHDGKYLVPGASDRCAGPDNFGACPYVGTLSGLPCSGATWHYAGPHGWTFHFAEDSTVCPVTVLDPLGPLPVPLD